MNAKKSLAPPRRDNKITLLQNKKNSPRQLAENSTSKQKNVSGHQNPEKKAPHGPSHSYEQKFRNKNLNNIPTTLLVALSALTTLDISYNKLSDSQIELVMNSCLKLSTLCTQGNLTTMIPASIWKLKELVNFKHDWLRINIGNEELYQPEERLRKLKTIVQKPEMVIKVNRIVGLDFQIYCREISHVTLDYLLLQKIQKSDCTNHAKEIMKKFVREAESSKMKQRPKMKPILQKDEFFNACTNMCGFEDPRKKQQKPLSILMKKQSISKQLSQAQTDAGSKNIRSKNLQDIRDISDKQLTSAKDISQKNSIVYNSPNFPLHQLFGNFDKNPQSPSQIDGMLLRGYNPNQYDSGGLSPYHTVIVHNQKKGFNYLLDISSNNPGFFDLQMPSQKQGRNILHYSVFLKNFEFTKQLIEFGIPIDKRDSSGARIIHLVDQNYEFLLLLKKIIKKTTSMARAQTSLAIPNLHCKKKYAKHPQRNKQQSKFRITYSRNEKLLDMYQSAVGTGVLKKK